ncbi:hypothetical protein NC652_024264 [Populus alba x Populus x berolinensis]|nr:hypothetical protein NC652_024264 [Populus alba x Populus x berolinensis]
MGIHNFTYLEILDHQMCAVKNIKSLHLMLQSKG